MHPIIILGAGHAAYSLAREIRRHDQEIPVTLITRDSGDSYYKPNLSKALAMGKTPAELVLKTRAEQEAALNITVLAEQRVTAVDAASQTVTLATGAVTEYAALVFATGADSRRFNLAGNANDAVLHVNDLDEYRIFADRIQTAKHVLIMGAGLVGCEFANDLYSQGIVSTLVDPAPYPLATLLPPTLGQTLQQGLNQIECQQYYGNHVTELNHSAEGYEATLANGEVITADIVLSAAGLSVDTRLAQDAGIDCNRGIQVNNQLATNQPHTYALGDCAEINGQLRPFIAPIMPSVKALAQSLLGNPSDVHFGPMPVTVKTPCCPVVACPPDQQEQGEWQLEGEAADLVARYLVDGELKGFACTGSCSSQAKTLQAEMA
jgi:rubredoxin-NAD+ reductase